jgi:phosphate transport system substrate-binding protein
MALWLGRAPPLTTILGPDALGQAGKKRVLGCDARKHADIERPEDHIDVRGTDAMLRFAQLVAEDYMGKNRGVTVTASGGGAARGIMSVIVGTADIALTDDTPEDLRKLAKGRGVDLEQDPVYSDLIYVYVAKENPVTSLTISEVRDIFSGQKKTWDTLPGGPPQKIVVINQEAYTSAFSTFKRTVLKDDAVVTSEAKAYPFDQFANEMHKSKWAIGYDGAEIADLKPVDIEGVRPSFETLASGQYLLRRQLSIVYCKNRRDTVGALVKYFLDRDSIKASVEAVRGIPTPPARPEK